jgi:hypothetical protein
MISVLHPLIAEVGQPLFGNQWLALLVCLGGVAVFIALVAALGRWLAATHPEPPPPDRSKPDTVPLASSTELTPSVCAVIAASVVATCGPRARIAAVQAAYIPSVEMLMQQWSVEGRRQIYSSHKIR